MIDVKLLQPEKVYSPTLVTEFGIVIDVKLLHQEKADFPIYVTELGIVTDVKLLQPLIVKYIDNQCVTCNKVEKS